MSREELINHISGKDRDKINDFLFDQINTDTLGKIECIFGDSKKTYNYLNKNMGYIEYKENGNNVIIDFIWSINSKFKLSSEKINGLGSFMIKEFLINSSYDEYIFKTITMNSRKFYFKVIRGLLKENIISSVEFVRSNGRIHYNKLDEFSKTFIKNNHAYSKIIIKK